MSTKEQKAHEANLKATEIDGVQCALDDVWVHNIPAYLKVQHPDVTLEAYQAAHPDSKLFSDVMEKARAKSAANSQAAMSATIHQLKAAPTSSIHYPTESRKPFAEVFGLGTAPAAMNKKGQPIQIGVLSDLTPELTAHVPEVDEKYIFDIDLLKTVMMAVEMRKNGLFWGFHGTGKTTVLEQYFAHTNRPAIRVQHTINTEEAHVLGQFILVGRETVFNPGPLAYAMRFGLAYIADEYDFALPSVTSVYQPVMEGKALVIKEACPEWRIVKPHPNFRFVATGNTNGGGDETGLYQGTQLQNAANYSRFGITKQVNYMADRLETTVVSSQGGIHEEDAKALVKVANLVREAYGRGDIGVTVSPRELINAAELGRAMGGDWRSALELAYTNRLNTTDREAVNSMIQRILPASA
jgi:cobaltochelatase CobS